LLQPARSSYVLSSRGWVPIEVTGKPDPRHLFRDNSISVTRHEGADGVIVSTDFWRQFPHSDLAPGQYTLRRDELYVDAYDTEIIRDLEKSDLRKGAGVHLGHVAALAWAQIDGSRGDLPLDKKAIFYVEGSNSTLCLQMSERGFEDGMPLWEASPWPRNFQRWPKGTQVYRLSA
jgi:hypothetical protein